MTAPTTDQDPLLEQLRVATRGDYDIYGELGRGGMATVYLAHEIALDRKVAIKVMAPGLLHGPGMVERFKREAKTAASLSHPNIIPIYTVREGEGLLYFVMKLIEGTPLDVIIKELGQLPIPMVEAILAQVGGAFGYAHRRGVVHRDIKPSNILIDDEGWAMVTDFGIAKVLESESLTQTGMAVGTPTYMSPEQCLGGEVSGASDQYALGTVAFEMLAGRPPFTGTGQMALMFSHTSQEVPSLLELRPDCPEPLATSVMRMLSKQPEARWPSMEEAVATFGNRQLAHDDPSRSQLISLARTSAANRIISQVQTPRSPVPLARSDPTARAVAAAAVTPAPVGNDRRWIWAAVGTIGVVGILAVLLLRPPRAAETALLPVAPSTPAPQAPPPASLLPPAPAPGPPQTPRSEPQQPTGRPAPPSRDPRAAATPSLLPPASAPAAAPSPAPAPAPAPPPPPSPQPSPPPAAVEAPKETATAVDDRAAIISAIQAYARALDQGDLALARRLNPGMTAEQRAGLEAFWKAGGTMRTQWSISDVTITDNEATARISGSNAITQPRLRPSDQPVSWRARLERRGAEWRLVSLGN